MSDLIRTDQLEWAHKAVDGMVEGIREETNTADEIWLALLDAIEPEPPERQLGHITILLTVALQKLAQQ